MKTNLSNLMNLVAEYERNFNSISYTMIEHVYSTTIEELDGRKNIIEDYKKDFEDELSEYNMLLTKIESAKQVISKKNNELVLPNGQTIADALISVNYLRKKMLILEKILNYKNSKRRVTEVNNSYFESKEINFDSLKMKEEYLSLQEKIQYLEFEISKLNSIEFEIEL